MRTYRYLDVLTAAFVAVLIVSNVVAVKAVRLFGLVDMDGGTLLFPVSYIFGDVLVEVYGYARSRRVIWMGFAANAMAVLMFMVVGALPSSPGWTLQESFFAILGQTPRVTAASLTAFLVGGFSNSYVMAKMKIWSRGRRLWTRTIGSTLVGQGLDSLLFQALAFGGVWSWGLIARVSLGNYLVKVAIEALFTPITYTVVARLKQREHEDFYDYDTRFNPFTLRV